MIGRGGHGFRKMLAGDVAAMTGNLKTAMDSIGDKDIRQAETYLRPRQDHIRQAFKDLDAQKEEVEGLSEVNLERTAEIDSTGRYRYVLTRHWAVTQPSDVLVVIGLNPSTADASQDDPTIRRCRGFALRWGFGGLTMLNLFAYRSTDPKVLNKVDDPVGPENMARLVEHTEGPVCVLCAWGTQGGDQAMRVVRLLRERGRSLHALGLTKDGHPRHPLYLPNTSERIPFARQAFRDLNRQQEVRASAAELRPAPLNGTEAD